MEKLRQLFWEKLTEEERNFRWFYVRYVKEHITGIAYSTLQIQAKGVHIQKIHPTLKKIMEDYVKTK